MGGLVLKTQLKKTGRFNLVPWRSSLFCWTVRSLLGLAVLGVVGASSFAQSPAAKVPQQASPSEAPVEQTSSISVDDLKQLSVSSQSVLAGAAEAVVAMDGGSGVIVSEDGWVMTASHVSVRPGRKIQVRLANGLQWPAKTYGVNRQKDTGMVKLMGEHSWPFVQLDQDAEVEAGDWCVVMGYPWEAESLDTPAVRLGRVTDVGENRIVSDVPIIGGDSGGPVFAMNGDLLAINSRIRLDVSQNIHIPVATYVQQFNELTREEFVRVIGVKKTKAVDASLVKKFGRNAAEIQNAVADLVAQCKPSVVRLVPQQQGEVTGGVMGTIVTKSGLVVSKKSELQLPVKARVGDDWMEAEIVSFDQKTDLALLQLKPKVVTEFVPLKNNAKTDVAAENLVGQLVLSVVENSENEKLEAALGTRMVAPQDFSTTVARQELDLGLVLDAGQSTGRSGLQIARVYPESIAAQSGLQNGDRLISIDGRDVTDEAGLQQLLATVGSGQTIRISIRRQGELRSFRVRLPAKLPLVWDRWGGGPFSGRRFGFGTVIAHDAVIDPSDCGGPVIDLEGNFVGINVSRAMRTTTYTIPATVVMELVGKHQQSQ